MPEWDIDIFTTNDELPFTGHPTIGAASYILNTLNSSYPTSQYFGEGLNGNSNGSSNAKVKGVAGGRSGTFLTKAGRIPISLSGQGGRVQAEIPHNVHIHAHTIGDLEEPIPGLSQDPVLREAEMRVPIVSIVKDMTFLLVRLESLEDLGKVKMSSPELSFHGLLDGGSAEGGFVARYYYVILDDGPRMNGDVNPIIRVRTKMLEVAMEDPATGSATYALACFLTLEEGRSSRFEVVQGVEMGRRSVIGVEVSRGVESVRLSGCALPVMEGSPRI